MTKYSFCTGINKYADPKNWLKGCVNDSLFWHYKLTHDLGFNGSVLNDARTTYQNFTDGIVKASEVLNNGDIFVLTYSGHGSSVPDKNGDEPDGLDECLCLYDKWLIDDDLRKLFDMFKPGVKITFISDSCHSGTVTREMTPEDTSIYKVPKYLVPPCGKDIAGKLTIKKGFSRIINSGKKEEDMCEILLSGCKSSQYSYDASFDGKPYGAFTYNCMQILQDKTPMTYTEFYNRLRKLLPTMQYPQTPQLEGKLENKNKLMFT